MCIYSLAQDAQYTRQTADGITYSGKIELFQDDKGNLSLCTTEGNPHSLYIYFAQYGPYKNVQNMPIQESVETFREDSVLHLKTASGKVLI